MDNYLLSLYQDVPTEIWSSSDFILCYLQELATLLMFNANLKICKFVSAYIDPYIQVFQCCQADFSPLVE